MATRHARSGSTNDERDKALADKLAEQDAVPTLPPQNESHKWDVKPPVKPQIHRSEIAGEPARTPQPQPQRTVNARELINVIVAAWMSDDRDRVTIEVRGSSIVIEQVMDENGQRTKTIWDIGIQHCHVSSRKLIK